MKSIIAALLVVAGVGIGYFLFAGKESTQAITPPTVVGAKEHAPPEKAKERTVVDQAKDAVADQVDPDGKMRQQGAETLDRAQLMMKKVEQDVGFSPQVKEWISSTIADAGAAAQTKVFPVLEQAWNKYPKHRDWLMQQAKIAQTKATGEAKAQWDNLISTWEKQKQPQP
ncbi:MAG: hypothetical protein JST40_09965 [Armatimonadetes bacterium]|nr:hypothetical protein [Armatimonadota bacterium]